MDDFIGTSVRDELIPDILLEIIDEINQEVNITKEKKRKIFIFLKESRTRWCIETNKT